MKILKKLLKNKIILSLFLLMPAMAFGSSASVPPQGTGVKSTGEAAGLFLRSDGADGAAWGSAAGPGANNDITSMTGLTGGLEDPTFLAFTGNTGAVGAVPGNDDLRIEGLGEAAGGSTFHVDVSTAPNDNDALTFDSASGTWIPQTAGADHTFSGTSVDNRFVIFDGVAGNTKPGIITMEMVAVGGPILRFGNSGAKFEAGAGNEVFSFSIGSFILMQDIDFPNTASRAISVELEASADAVDAPDLTVNGSNKSNAGSSGNGGDLIHNPGDAAGSGRGGNAVWNLATSGSGTPGDFQILGGNGLIVGAPTGGAKGPGTINATSVFDDNVLLTDFVFEEDYEQKSIDEMETFYKEEKHLPTIDGRDEWEKNGKFSLGKITTQVWETVEVQAIYIAGLNTRLKKLEAKCNF